MLENAVARRYAQAFFAIAQEKQMVDKLEAELKSVVDTINAHAELKKVLDHQLISAEEKREILTNLFSGEISELSMNLISVVADKNRAPYIPAIYDEFVSYANALRNMAEAEVKVAFELSESELETIKNRLSAATGKTIRLQSNVDPSLIGGVMVRIGDKVIDGSIAGRLTRLKSSLLQTEVKEIGVRN